MTKKATKPRRSTGDRLHRLAAEVNDASQRVEDKVEPVLISEPLKSIAYTIKHRVKDTVKIKRKVARKRQGARAGTKNWRYEPTHVTDGCGFRIVTLFQKEIVDVVAELIKMIQHDGQYSVKNPFTRDGLKEVTIFTNRPPDEEGSIHVQVKEKFDSAGYSSETCEPENRKSGYSSVHLVVEVPVEIPQDDGSSRTRLQPMEIQVRDIFEEAWGEISHFLRYAQERGDLDLEEHPLFDMWKPHLNALKTFADGCSQEAEIIRTNAIDASRYRQIFFERKPAERPEIVVDMLTEVLPKRFHTQVRETFDGLKKAIDTMGPETRREAFNEALHKFEDLFTATKKLHNKKTKDGRNVGFRITMEIAYCVHPETDEEFEKVAGFYEVMHTKYPDDVVAYYRHAMLERRRVHIDRSVELFKAADEALPRDQTISEDSWIRIALPRNLGTSYWRQADAMKEAPEKRRDRLKLLEMAIHESHRAIINAETLEPLGLQFRHSLNNFIWYTTEYLRAKPTGKRGKITKTRLRKKLSELNKLTSLQEPENLFHIHTLMMGFDFLGDTLDARKAADAANKIMYQGARQDSGNPDLRIDEVREHLSEEVQDIHDDALRILFPISDS